MKIWTVLLFLVAFLNTQAQEVVFNGVTYKVKGKTILKDGADVTSTLTLDEQLAIKKALEKEIEIEKEAKEAEKKLKKAEKERKSAEKKQKKAEKELKARQKAQSNFEKTEKKYSEALEKYEKLKKKGKLSPNDEAKWLEKIKDLKEANEKAKRKL